MKKELSLKITPWLSTVLSSTGFAFVILVSYQWLQALPWDAFSKSTLRAIRPGNIWILPIISIVCALGILCIVFVTKILNSLRLGLISPVQPTWAISLTICWILFARQRYVITIIPILCAIGVTVLVRWIRRPISEQKNDISIDPDLALPEDGTDLLNRGEIINRLASIVIREKPSVIALTGAYGDGKSSLLNLTVGKLRKLEAEQRPLIIQFSPWLAADSNALITSLLTSIVAEIRKEYTVSGLAHGMKLYARALMNVIPKAKLLEEFVKEPSQYERVHGLTTQIARMPRRILVILDDLDRMQARELETVFKILRGSENLLNVTFVCSFDHKELSSILRSTRRFQNTSKFIEKFFQVTINLPRIDSAQIKDIFTRQMSECVSQFLDDKSKKHFPTFVDELWESGGARHFTNLRALKLYSNKIRYSLPIIGAEVNIEDFLRLELIRDIQPSLYEDIFINGKYFYEPGMAIETWGQRLHLDKDKEKKALAGIYEQLKAKVPSDKQYVFSLVSDLFPAFARYDNRFGATTPHDGEKERRLFHPRYFRQYFVFRAPSEYFSQERFKAFQSSLKEAAEETAIEQFSAIFRSLIKEEFKRWHFLHLIDGTLDTFSVNAARGICRGMAQNSSHWGRDDFEFEIAIRCTYQTLLRIQDSVSRRLLVQRIIDESSSALYTLHLFWVIETRKDADAAIVANLEALKPYLEKHLAGQYLVPNTPSVYDQFDNVWPHALLFAWLRLGPQAAADVHQYIRNLFQDNPDVLNRFLNLLFRVEFIDDYEALKPLFDYDEVSKLIDKYEDQLDSKKVQQFRERYNQEKSQGEPDSLN